MTSRNTKLAYTPKKRMLDAKITLNDKCLFSQLEIKFLKHAINVSSIRPDNNKVTAIFDTSASQNVTELRSFWA